MDVRWVPTLNPASTMHVGIYYEEGHKFYLFEGENLLFEHIRTNGNAVTYNVAVTSRPVREWHTGQGGHGLYLRTYKENKPTTKCVREYGDFYARTLAHFKKQMKNITKETR